MDDTLPQQDALTEGVSICEPALTNISETNFGGSNEQPIKLASRRPVNEVRMQKKTVQGIPVYKYIQLTGEIRKEAKKAEAMRVLRDNQPQSNKQKAQTTSVVAVEPKLTLLQKAATRVKGMLQRQPQPSAPLKPVQQS